MKYALRIEPDGDGFLAKFRDIPEALTGGDTYEETIELAQDALISAMDFYFEDKRKVPAPTALQDGEVAIDLPMSLAAKVLLLNEMLEQNIRPALLASKLHTTRQEVNRLTNLHHQTKIDNVANALKVLGKELTLHVL